MCAATMHVPIDGCALQNRDRHTELEYTHLLPH